MTDLIVGASGFLGRHLAEMLIARGEEVDALVRHTSRIADLPGVHRVVCCSLADVDGLARAMRGIRFVYNCAGLSADWAPWEQFEAVNIDGVANLLEAARRSAVERFVHVSTTDIYGYPHEPCDETRGFHDVGLPYNRSKGIGDELALSFCRRTGLPVTVVRPATIFGPRSKDWVVELGRHLIAGHVLTIDHGSIPAGLVYVGDVADAMAKLAASAAAVGEAYNVVDPTPMNWRDYFACIADALEVAPPRMNLPGSLAFATARVSEDAYRLLRIRSRPLLTRHVVLILTRTQHYIASKLHDTAMGFPETGLRNGLALTAAWLRSPEGRRTVGGRLGHV